MRARTNSACAWRSGQAAAGLFARSFLRTHCLLFAGCCVRVSCWAARRAAFSFAGPLVAMRFSQSTCIRTAACGPRRRAYAAVAAMLQHSSGDHLHPNRRCADGRIARQSCRYFPNCPPALAFTMCCLARRSVFRFCSPPCRDVSPPRWCTGKPSMWAWIASMC